MKAESIFGPVSALALWTCGVLFLSGYRRVRAVMTRQLRSSDFRIGESEQVPVSLVVLNRHYMNLLEMPILFYVVCVALFVTQKVDATAVWIAWLYVALRLVHSVIHLTTNRVLHRFVPFAISHFVLFGLWLLFVSRQWGS